MVSVLLVLFALPYFNDLSGKELALTIHGNVSLFGSLLGIMLVTGLLSGSYPALLLSSFKPARVLKGTLKIGGKSTHIRKLLVVVQFSLSTFLIISTLVVSKQLHYIQSKKLGFEKNQLVSFSIPFKYENKYNTLKNELLKRNDITHVTRMRHFPTSDNINSYTGLDWEGKNPRDKVLFCIHDVGYDFFKTFGMTMLEGRSFSRAFPTDNDSYIVNEKAAEIMGMKNPVGKMFSQDEQKGTIIGVVKNFHFKSLKNEIEPLVFRLPLHHANKVFIKVSSHDITTTLKYIERTWKKFVPDYPFEFQFLDDAYNRLYRSEMRTGIVINAFTFLAILITAMGLFGLASFSAEKRKKEIGIRKVVGASVPQVIKLLLNEFMILVVLANIISWPAAYFAMKYWLQNYAYHTDLSLQAFIIAFVTALVIAVISVSYQSIKAATANPVESLRYE